MRETRNCDGLGLRHIYHGNGKGKTTCAIGLCSRMLGAGYRVGILQFLKNSSSSEIALLEGMPNVRLYKNAFANKFTNIMSSSEKDACAKEHMRLFEQAKADCKSGKLDLLLLDEVLDAIACEMFDENLLLDALSSELAGIEVVITGRNPSQKLIDIADYITHFEKQKHPYDIGICARLGVDK